MAKPTASEGEFPTSYEQYQAGKWPYEVVPKDPAEHDDAITWQGLHEFAFQAENGEVYAGCYPRAMINNAANTDQPLMIGASDRGNQSVGILHDERYRHIFCGGQTGAGKTVAAKNAVQQDALAGHGVCVIDPGGEDILDIVRSLPEYRLDDLIYMEPGNEYRSHSIGLNYLDTLHNPGEPGYKKECESIATNLLPMLNADEFARMKGVASNMLRYLIKADHEDDDYEYTLIDLYYMLASEDARQQYAEKVTESKLDFLKVYANKIADLAGDKLEPLLRRLQTWVENDVMRPFIAQRDSDFSIADAVENQRIVLVKANLGKNEREMITAALTTKLWSAVTSRPNADERTMMEYEGVDVPELGADEGGDHKPFFLVADEFHAVASENTDIGEMLAMARKKGLGLYILTQQLGQLSDEQQQQILGNCSTLMAFDPGRHPKERRALASGFDGISEPDLGIGRYKFWTTLTDAEGDESQAFLTHSIPPFPPVRSVKEANEALNRSQMLHGSKRLTDQEIIEQVPDEFSIEVAKEHLGDETTDGGPDGSTERPALVRAKALQAIHDDGYYNGDPDGFVSLQEAHKRIARYIERVSTTVPDTPSKIEGLIGQFPERLLERDRRGELHVRCTDEGKARFLSPVDEDDEISENTGGFEHAELMRAAYDDLLAIGLPLHVVRQGGDDDPDALAEPESAELRRANSNPSLKPTDVASLVETFREENPLLDRLTDAGTVDIEAEHSTGDSAPGVTLEHIARSIANGRRCLLLAWPDTAEAIARRLDEHPECMRSFSGEDGAHRLYNANGDLRAGPNEVKVYRPVGGQSVWLYHENSESVDLRDSDGDTLATFNDPEDVFSNPTTYPATEKDISNFSEWTAIKRPALPGRIDRDMVDVIAVTDTGLEILEPNGVRTPIGELLDESSDGDTADRDQEQANDDGGAFADLL